MHDYEKKVRKVGFCTVIQRVRIDAFDPGRLLNVLGMQWKEFYGLKRPANKFSELSLQEEFSS